MALVLCDKLMLDKGRKFKRLMVSLWVVRENALRSLPGAFSKKCSPWIMYFITP